MKILRSEIPGDSVLDYLRSQCAEHAGNGGWLGLLFSQLDLREGRVEAYLPDSDAGARCARDFDGVLPESAAARRALTLAAATWVRGRMRSADDVLVMEEWRASDWAPSPPAHAFKIGRSVFEFARNDMDDHAIANLLDASLWHPSIGGILCLPNVGAGGRPSADLFAAAAARPRGILVGAWGAEGYLLWRPCTSGPPQRP